MTEHLLIDHTLDVMAEPREAKPLTKRAKLLGLDVQVIEPEPKGNSSGLDCIRVIPVRGD